MSAQRVTQVLAWAAAIAVAIAFLFPFLWMFASSFREQDAILTNPLRLIPEQLDFKAYREIATIGGVPLIRFALNSLGITIAATALAVAVTALGAYALDRRPKLPGFALVKTGFLLVIMYPYMLLVIPVYVVMHKLGLLGTYAGVILFLSVGPVQFFLFEQFFRTIPREVIEAAQIDGATEWQILWRVILPIAKPVVGTVTLVTFLLTWSQWFPILVISGSPDTYTLPVALLLLNSELGANFQGIMALATLTTLPSVLVFLATQRRVVQGMAAGAVKG